MVYNINGVENILVHVGITDDNKKLIETLIEKYKCIIQDFTVINKVSLFGFLGLYHPKVKLAVLVPTKHIIEFNNELYK